MSREEQIAEITEMLRSLSARDFGIMEHYLRLQHRRNMDPNNADVDAEIKRIEAAVFAGRAREIVVPTVH